jgi:ATP-grasp domain
MVQPMAAPGVELLVGVVHDESLGALIACGAGGTSAELLKDVAVRIAPLSDLDAREMLRSLRTFPLLDGYRGATRCDLGAIEDVLPDASAWRRSLLADRSSRCGHERTPACRRWRARRSKSP